MRKVISLSALVSGLLASPAFATSVNTAIRRAEEAGEPAEVIQPDLLTEQAQLTPEMLQAELLEMVEKGPVDIGNMRAFQRRVARQMKSRLQYAIDTQGPQTAPQSTSHTVPQNATGQIEFNLSPIQLQSIQRMEKGTFLGVTTSHVTATLGEQLNLPKGMGLVVDFIAKDSPAEAAGLRVHDVLTKFDDQLLVNLEQLAVLVRSKKADDAVTLTVMRGGKTVTLTAKLVEKEVPVIDENTRWHGAVDSFPGDALMARNQLLTADERDAWHMNVKKRVDDKYDISIQPGVGKLAGQTILVAKEIGGKEIYHGPFTTEEERKKIPPDVLKEADELMANKDVSLEGGGFRLRADQLTVTRNDAEYDIALTIVNSDRGSGRTVVIKEAKTGKVLYDGPAETDDDFKKMPASAAEKVRGLEGKLHH